MADDLFFFEIIKGLLEAYPLLISFFGPLLGGEMVFVFLAFFSTQGIIPVWFLFLCGFLVSMFYDFFWLTLPRTAFFRRTIYRGKIKRRCDAFNKNFKKTEEKELVYLILLSKFLLGTRILTMTSVSLNRIKFKDILLPSFLSALIWSLVYVFIGIMVGEGYNYFRSIFDSTRIALSIVFFLIIIFVSVRYLLHSHLHKDFTKKLKK